MQHKYLEKTLRMADTLRQQLAAAKKALEWYADGKQYDEVLASGTLRYRMDRGQVARDALAHIEELGK